jgi:outer membrane protease
MSLKKRLLISLVCMALALLPGPVFGQSAQAFTLSTTTSSGVLYGESFDYVYNQNVSTNYKNSELDWPFQPVFYTGEHLSLTTGIGVFATLDVKEGLPGNGGTMTDSDFLNGNGVRTHYSQSESYMERAVLADLAIGYDLPIGAFTFGASVSFSYMDFKWSARDGYYQYPTSGYDYYFNSSGFVPGTDTPWSASETKTPLYGTGILNEQTYLIGSAGLQASWRILDSLSLSASFSYAPLAYCFTADNHELRLINFYSTLSNGFMIEPRLDVTYVVAPHASIALSVDYRQLFNLIGNATEVNQGTTSTGSDGNYYAGPDSAATFTNGEGASLWMFDAGLMLKIEL